MIIYINECCWGGDVVRDQLLPLIASRFADVDHGQEDWGWYLWFRKDALRMELNIHCDDSSEGAFRILLTCRRKKLLSWTELEHSPELDEIRDLVVPILSTWAGRVEIEKEDMRT